MTFERRTALVVGVLFILTFVTSIGALPLYGPALNDSSYVLGAGADWSISAAVILEIALIVTNIGTAVVLFPLLRRTGEAHALGYVTARVMECAVIAIGVVSMMSVVLLRQRAALEAGVDAEALLATARGLVAVHDATFMLGPGFGAPIGNGLILGTLMLRARLLPGKMAWLGIVGGTMGMASASGVLFGVFPPMSLGAFVFMVPEILWEAFLGIWLTAKGFRAVAPAVRGRVEQASMREVRASA